MPSFMSTAIVAALATLGAAQTPLISGKVQAKSAKLGTVYLYKQFNDGGYYALTGVGAESQADEIEFRSDGLITNLSKGEYLNINTGVEDEKAFTFRPTYIPESAWSLVDGNRIVSDGSYWGRQDEFQACNYAGAWTIFLSSHVVDGLECTPIGGLYFV